MQKHSSRITKNIVQGLKEFGETVASNFIGGQKGTTCQPPGPSLSTNPGVVTIIDTQVRLID